MYLSAMHDRGLAGSCSVGLKLVSMHLKPSWAATSTTPCVMAEKPVSTTPGACALVAASCVILLCFLQLLASRGAIGVGSDWQDFKMAAGSHATTKSTATATPSSRASTHALRRKLTRQAAGEAVPTVIPCLESQTCSVEIKHTRAGMSIAAVATTAAPVVAAAVTAPVAVVVVVAAARTVMIGRITPWCVGAPPAPDYAGRSEASCHDT